CATPSTPCTASFAIGCSINTSLLPLPPRERGSTGSEEPGMRRAILSLLVVAFGLPAACAADLRHFDDAALHAVHFVDAAEGWAVGDDGVVWHTLDHGQTWERQPTGVRASLRAVHFVNLSTGWIAGREELPHNGGSSGVLLYTRDGGVKWQCVSTP